MYIESAVLAVLIVVGYRLFRRIRLRRKYMGILLGYMRSEPGMPAPSAELLLTAIGDRMRELDRRSKLVIVRLRDNDIIRPLLIEHVASAMDGVYLGLQQGRKGKAAVSADFLKLEAVRADLETALQSGNVSRRTANFCWEWLADLLDWMALASLWIYPLAKRAGKSRKGGP